MLIDVKRMESFPPFLVAALARNQSGDALTMPQIADAAGLPLRSVCRIASRLTWAGVTLDNIEKFCRGCNFNLKSTRKQFDFLRKTPLVKHQFSHLSPIRRRTFERRIVEWQKLQSGR